MRSKRSHAVLAVAGLLAFTGLQSTSTAGDSLPWAFKAEAAKGYSIDLVSADPVPGTALAAGSSVQFKITVTYSMTIAAQGTIVLVFQDEANRPVKSDQVHTHVTETSGSVTLSDTVSVPRNAKELRLFIPLVPEGLTRTTGEITLRYPIRA